MLSLLNIKDRVFYGWVVVIAGLTISTFSIGIRLSFGVFFKSIEGEFGLTRGATSSIFSIYMLSCSIFAILGGWALDRYGPRAVTLLAGSFTGLSLLLIGQTNSAWQLFITYGLLLSLGTGAIYTIVNSTTSRWFDKKRGFALAITSSGGGLGIIVMAPFATYLISNFDWRTAFVVLGLIAWLVMPSLSMLLRKDPSDLGLLPDGAKPEAAKTNPNIESNTRSTGLSLAQASRTRPFWFLGFVWLLLSLSVHLILVHAIPYAVDMGISPAEAAVILSLIGGSTILGRLVVGRVSDTMGRKAPAAACALLQAGTLLGLIWARDLWTFYAFAIVFGFSWGGIGNMILSLISDVFGTYSIGVIMGAIGIGWELGAATGPAMGGFIFDASGSYSTAFAITAAIMLVVTVLMSLIRHSTRM